MTRTVKASLSATLSLAVLAGCDAAALRNLAQTVTPPPASEQQATAKDYKSLEGTWYLLDGENTQNFNPEKGTFTFVKEGNNFQGSGTFTLFGGAQKSLTKLTLTKEKPRTGTQANISIDFTVTDTKIIGKIYDENAGSTDKSVGELTGNFAEAANGSTKLDLSFVANRQFGGQPGNTVPGITPGGESTGGGDNTVTPGDGEVVPSVLPRVGDLAGAWIFELGDAPLFAGQKTGILLELGVNGGIEAKVLQEKNGSLVPIGVVTGLNVDRDGNGMANLVGVLELEGGQKLNVRYVATFIKDGLNANGRWILRSGVLEGIPFTVTIPARDGGGAGPTDPAYPDPSWLTSLRMSGDQRLAIDSGVTNPDLGNLGLRVTRTTNGAMLVELFQPTQNGPNTVAQGELMPAGPDGPFVAKAFANILGGEIRIELMAPPAGGDRVGVKIFNAANELLLKATLEAFDGGNQGDGKFPLAIDEVLGQWSVSMSDRTFNPIGADKFALAIFNDGGYRASITAYDSQGHASAAGQIVNLRLEGYPGGTDLLGDCYVNSATPFKVRFRLMDNRMNPNQRPWLLTDIEISDGMNQGNGSVAPADQQQPPAPEPYVALPDSILGEYALYLMGPNPYGADFGLFLGTVATGNRDKPLLFTASLFGQASGSVAYADDLKITKRDDGSFVAEGVLNRSQGVNGPDNLMLTLNFLADGSVGGAFVDADTNTTTTTFAASRPSNGGGGSGSEPPMVNLPKVLQGRYTMKWYNGNPYGRELQASFATNADGDLMVELVDKDGQVAMMSSPIIKALDADTFSLAGVFKSVRSTEQAGDLEASLTLSPSGLNGYFRLPGSVTDVQGAFANNYIEQPVGPDPNPQPAPLPTFAVGGFDVEVQASSASPFPQFLRLTVKQDPNGKPVIQLGNANGALYELQDATFMPEGDGTDPVSTGVLFQGTFRSTLLESLPETLSAKFTIRGDGAVSGDLGNMVLSSRQAPPPPMARYELKVSGLAEGLYTRSNPFLNSDVSVFEDVTGDLYILDGEMYASDEQGNFVPNGRFSVQPARQTGKMSIYFRSDTGLIDGAIVTGASRYPIEGTAIRAAGSDYVLEIAVPVGESIRNVFIDTKGSTFSFLGFAYDAPVQN
ncbi:MAG: hypothetical protein VKP57_12465 [Candidatus Sericytochromatia bacterium]|nr:hypothetical protein [Candidatus Sericytochromatia bacterium]